MQSRLQKASMTANNWIRRVRGLEANCTSLRTMENYNPLLREELERRGWTWEEIEYAFRTISHAEDFFGQLITLIDEIKRENRPRKKE